MQIGYVLIEHFAVALERRRHPELDGNPVVIGGHSYERKMVYDASAEAVANGVRTGLPLRQAQQLCPNAVFLPPDLACYQETNETFLATLERFSPAVVPDALGSAYFDARGLERMLRVKGQSGVAGRILDAVERYLSLSACIGLAPTRFAASVAARLSRPGVPLAVGDAAALLCDLPLEYLPGDAELYERLHLLGLSTIGQFVRLPQGELMEQFGPAGVMAYALARGHGELPLAPRVQPAALWQIQEFEPPLRDGATLAQAISRMSAVLAAQLQQRYQACQTVILRLMFGGKEIVALERTAQLKEPAIEAKAIAALAVRLGERLCLERVDELLTLEIVEAELAVTGLIGQGGTQPGLFDAQRQRRAAVERAAAEVERRFGKRLKRAEPAPPTSADTASPFVLRDWSTP